MGTGLISCGHRTPVVETEDDMLGHDHCDRLAQGCGTGLSGNVALTEEYQVENVGTGKKNEVN